MGDHSVASQPKDDDEEDSCGLNPHHFCSREDRARGLPQACKQS